jgi:hypothetical protein
LSGAGHFLTKLSAVRGRLNTRFRARDTAVRANRLAQNSKALIPCLSASTRRALWIATTRSGDQRVGDIRHKSILSSLPGHAWAHPVTGSVEGVQHLPSQFVTVGRRSS